MVCEERGRAQLCRVRVSSLFNSGLGGVHMCTRVCVCVCACTCVRVCLGGFFFYYLIEAPVTLSSTLTRCLFCPAKSGSKQRLGHLTGKLIQAKHRLIVSNNAFDHEISGSDYYPEREFYWNDSGLSSLRSKAGRPS